MKILIVRIGALGDAIHALPMVNELRRGLPECEIHWAAGSAVRRFLDGHRAVNRFLEVKRSAAGYWKLYGDIRSGYDIAIDAQGLLKSALIARAASSRVIGRGPGFAREWLATRFYSELVLPRMGHIIDQNLDLLLPLELGLSDRRIVYDLSPPEAPAWPLLEERPVIFNIGGGWPTKLWAPDRFAALARRIRNELGFRIGVVWGPGEQKDAEWIANHSPAELAPPTTFAQLGAIFGRARALVSGETGPLHLAVAVGCRAVALLGPTSARRNGPYGEGHAVVAEVPPCSPCYARRCGDFRCMPGIGVERVFDALRGVTG